MAMDELRSQGYTVVLVSFARFDVVAAALARGDLDFAHTSNQLIWAAIAKGSPIRTLMTRNIDPYLMVTKQEIQSCGDLNNKVVALPTTAGLTSAIFIEYQKQYCQVASPQIAVMSGDRYPGLISGQLDAALLELDDWLELERQAPGRFHVLIDFAKEFPQLEITAYHVHQDFAAKHHEIVKDFVRALVKAHRQVQAKPVLQNTIVEYASLDSARAQTAADAYLAHDVWDVNGRLTYERVQYTLDFLAKAGSLPAGMKAEQVADLSYLDAVLKEIGRK